MMILDDDYEDPGECTDALAAGENAGMGDESFDEELQRFTEALAEAPEECVEAENEAALAAPAGEEEQDPELQTLSKKIQALKFLGNLWHQR